MIPTAWELLLEKRATVAPSLRRQFWIPVRNLLQMFHILPIAAAAAVFFLLGFDGQLTEIYITYLEDIASPDVTATVFRFVAAAFGFALISAFLYEAHSRMTGRRINVMFSMTQGTGLPLHRMQRVQESSAIVIALSPWLGLAAGLLNTSAALNGMFNLLRQANAPLSTFEHVPFPSAGAAAAAVLILAVVMAWLASSLLRSRTLNRVMLLNPIAAAFVFLLLTGEQWFGIAPISAILVISLAYYAVYYRSRTLRALRTQALQQDDNFGLQRKHQIILFVWALLPWVAAFALYLLLPSGVELKAWLRHATPTAPDKNPLPSLAMIPVALCWVSAIGLLAAALLYNVRDSGAARFWLYCIVSVLAAAGLLVFWLATAEQIVILYRLAGPLCALALALLFVISIFVVLAVLSQRSNFPALTLSIAVLVASATLPLPAEWSTILISALCLALAVVALLSRLFPAAVLALLLIAIVLINYSKSRESPLGLYSQNQGVDLSQQFNAWLDSRGVPPVDGKLPDSPVDSCFAPTSVGGQPKRHPVYIIAVEGGGIYAASAGSMFLARLQDENPCFSDHVFAISAVSGGAIGSTIFQTLEATRLNALLMTAASPATTLARDANAPRPQTASSINTSQPCQPTAGSSTDFSLEGEVCRIIQGDHFSPLVGSIFPEFLGFVSKGRAKELAASFQHSVKAESEDAGVMLGAHYTDHWTSKSKAPALVLNGTWVETGFRAVFAPFPLHAIDDSLYSFLDQNMPMNSSESLIDAAIVSARFPFVLPPYSIEVGPAAGGQKGAVVASETLERWNFIDGGYSDSSGAATALSIYKALQSAAQSRNVALRVILVTSSDPKLKPSEINGTTFADIMGPIDAILSARKWSANEAVARACDGVMGPSQSSGSNGGGQNTCEDQANKMDSALQIVGIEDQNYGLSLGWKISQTTFSVVSWMLGQPNLCNNTSKATSQTETPSQTEATSQNGQVIVNEEVVGRNSCALLSVRQALGPPPAAPELGRTPTTQQP